MHTHRATVKEKMRAGQKLIQVSKEHCVLSTTCAPSLSSGTLEEDKEQIHLFFNQIEELVRALVDAIKTPLQSKHDFYVYFLQNFTKRVENAPYIQSREFESEGLVKNLHEMIHLFIERGPLSQNTLCRVLSECISIALSKSVNVYVQGGSKVQRAIVPLVHLMKQGASLESSNCICVLNDKKGEEAVTLILTKDVEEGDELSVSHLEIDLTTAEGRDVWLLCHGKKH
eukprot:PhF_6_TR443/c0_g1_i1/m.168